MGKDGWKINPKFKGPVIKNKGRNMVPKMEFLFGPQDDCDTGWEPNPRSPRYDLEQYGDVEAPERIKVSGHPITKHNGVYFLSKKKTRGKYKWAHRSGVSWIYWISTGRCGWHWNCGGLMHFSRTRLPLQGGWVHPHEKP